MSPGSSSPDRVFGVDSHPESGLWGYAAVFLLALAARTVYFLEIADSAVVSTLLGDGRRYHEWALEISAGNWLGNEVFYQAPLYPYFLALIYTVAGPHAWAARLVQAAGSALSCVLLAAAGRNFVSPSAGWLAGALLALYPPALFFDALLQKASLGLLFLTALLAVLGRARDSGSRRWPLLAGLLLGGLALLRENALVLIPVVGVWFFVCGRNRSEPARWAQALLLLVLGVAALLVPVGLRNKVVGNEFLITTSQSGSNFYIGNNPSANGKYVPLRARGGDARVERQDARELAEAEEGRELTPREVSWFWWGEALEFIRAQPGSWARLMIHKTRLVCHASEVVDTDSIEASSEHSRILGSLRHLLHFGVICPLAALGLWLTRDRWRRLWILYAMTLALVASLVAFYVVGRYRFPLAPILIVFAAAGLVELGRILARSQGFPARPLVTALALIVLVGLVVNWPLAAGPDPRATTYLNLGLTLTDEERLTEAIEHLERAVELAPDVAATHRALARAHNRLGASLIAEGKLDEASVQLRRAIAIDIRYPQPAEGALAHDQLANILAHRGELGPAIAEYEAALSIEPDFGDARFKLGSLLNDADRPAEAVPHLEAAVRLLPDFPAAQLALARVRERLGDYGSALDAYRMVLEFQPENTEAEEALKRLGALY